MFCEFITKFICYSCDCRALQCVILNRVITGPSSLFVWRLLHSYVYKASNVQLAWVNRFNFNLPNYRVACLNMLEMKLCTDKFIYFEPKFANGEHQPVAFFSTNAEILLIRIRERDFCEILCEIHAFSLKNNAFENVVCEMVAILHRPQCVNSNQRGVDNTCWGFFCLRTFFANIGLKLVAKEFFFIGLTFPTRIICGVFQDMWLVVFMVLGVVDWPLSSSILVHLLSNPF